MNLTKIQNDGFGANVDFLEKYLVAVIEAGELKL
jgi:hypothetical protein